MKEPMTRLAYCQYLLVTPINYTLTYFADHRDGLSHDAINRYLREEHLTPRLLWENVRGQVIPSARGYLLFDDTVLDGVDPTVMSPGAISSAKTTVAKLVALVWGFATDFRDSARG